MWMAATVGVAALAAVAFVSLTFGIVELNLRETIEALFRAGTAPPQAEAVVWAIRLPRILVAMLVGAALATVGAVMQAILRNSLAEPGVTGVSAGAAVGAVASITFGAGVTHGAPSGDTLGWGVPVAAFIGATLVTFVLLAVLQFRKDLGPATIILVGVSINALAGALITVLIANAPDDALVRSAMFWLSGDLDLRTWHHVLLAVVPITLGVIIMLSRARALDTLSLGEQIAATSGVNVQRERVLLLLVASLVTGAAVAVAGIISFVGLVVPHAVRLIVGAPHLRLLPISALGGALFMVLADTLARSAFAPVVVQTGVVAALVGAPIFLFLLLNRARA